MSGNKKTPNDFNAINKFARTWIDKFNDLSLTHYEYTDDMSFPDFFFSQGFIMDCGESFSKKYGEEAFNSYDSLKSIIDTVDDIMVLGAGIFSQWRYYNHWASSPAEILVPQVRSWFITAFTRFAELSEIK